MQIGTAFPSDVDEIVSLGKRLHSYSGYHHVRFDDVIAKEFLLYSINNENRKLIIMKENGVIIGVFIGVIESFYFSSDLLAYDMVFFVVPEHRRFQYALRVVEMYKAWAVDKGARRIMLSQSTGLDPERTRRLYERFGFQYVGSNFCYKA